VSGWRYHAKVARSGGSREKLACQGDRRLYVPFKVGRHDESSFEVVQRFDARLLEPGDAALVDRVKPHRVGERQSFPGRAGRWQRGAPLISAQRVRYAATTAASERARSSG